MITSLTFLEEPHLLFHQNQIMTDPRDGLTLFGPLDAAKPEGIRWAAVGTKRAIEFMKEWVSRVQRPVASGSKPMARPLFPGFEAAFRTKLNPSPVIEIEVPDDKLRAHTSNRDRHQRVYRTVDLYSSRILSAIRNEDSVVDVWCVLIPDYVYLYCRPQSVIPVELRIEPHQTLSLQDARSAEVQPFLFDEMNVLAEEYLYEVNFHHQLKARLLKRQAVTQIIRESTIAFREVTNMKGEPLRDLEKVESSIAWHLSTALFYKSGGRPWKLGSARTGVCYIGLVYKRDERSSDTRTACCGAQMFLDSGDGVVFKGALGPWYRPNRKAYHLDKASARAIVRMCIKAYEERNSGARPAELFIHGKVSFSDEEYAGFKEGAGPNIHVVGVRIREWQNIKLFRLGDMPVLRGLAFMVDRRRGYLWANGMVPRLRTYPGREVPKPLLVDICQGDAELETVMKDVLALTKLNYNACNFADGWPITLKFSDAVGEILTAGPSKKLQVPPLPFKYYI